MSDGDTVLVKRALFSVSDKTGLVEFASALAERGIALVASGGTARALADGGLEASDVSDLTGYREMMDGRVKTLHPAIHGGILARRDLAAHREAMEANGIAPIDLVVVNLYPFERTAAGGADRDEAVEQIDIGGPALIRAAAKNHEFVVVATGPEDYEGIVRELAENDGGTTLDFRRCLAAAAYARTAAYDAAISQWFARDVDIPFPRHIAFGGTRAELLRYGENPHQEAALYRALPERPGAASADSVQGKALSYNNLGDADAAFELVAEFDGPAIAIVKHANPCGAAVADTLAEAHARAFACDPVSAFGGVVAANRRIDEATARAITGIFVEVVIAPHIDEAARAIFAEKPNIRVPTRRAPTDAERRDLLFAFAVAKHVKSNAIVFARNGATVGIGAGQMSRVDSTRIAALKAADIAREADRREPGTIGSVAASDAFFPFADGLVAAAEAGATAVIQPGGSVRDEEVIAAADERGIAMVFTGRRHFRH